MKLDKIKEITGRIILKSGLHIGAGDTEMKIGGTDNPVIKHPHTLEPYIPGSSLKGKIRSLLEMRSGLMVKTGGSPVSLKTLQSLEGEEKEECAKILKLFGASGADADEGFTLGPTRASFADCLLDDVWKEKASEEHLPLTEVKSENSINRIRGTAENPRFTERVTAGTEFRFCITLKRLGPNEDLEMFLLEGMKLLQMDALGGSGSRGYGRINFEFDHSELNAKFKELAPL
ncbi:MAG: type III-A CRISPR-associated RAMP protein Csm3 [Proteobacteria bacterium]|nr:type III-A CRISPR-associated RAMP protein Csm3 [Pseudomonadota bacterium]